MRSSSTVVICACLSWGLWACQPDDRPAGRVQQEAVQKSAQLNPAETTSVGTVEATPLPQVTVDRTGEVSLVSQVRRDDAVPNLCTGLMSENTPVKVPPMARPAMGEFYEDPAFGARVVRITDTRNGQVVKPMYSTIQSWNADESRLLLYHTGGAQSQTGHHLYDGRNYQHLGKLDLTARDIEEVFWDHEDPDLLYYVSVYFKHYGSLMSYNVRTDKKTELRRFDEVCGEDSVPVAGNGVMMPSWDDDMFGFRCKDSAGRDVAFTWQRSSDAVRRIRIGEGSDYQPWMAPMPAPSGKRYLLEEDILDPSLKKAMHRLDLSEFHSHADLGRLRDGSDAFFATAYDPAPGGCDGGKDRGVGQLVIHDLEKRTCRVMIGDSKGWGYPGSGTHISATAHKNPGWVALSTIGYGQFEYLQNGQPAPVLFSEIYLANTDPTKPEICRVAHHRSHSKDSTRGGYTGYLGEPHPTLSPTGTRIAFGSDWYDSGSVDTYIIELPTYQR